ncbi:MAG TPA: cyclic nucleotide-binding domain-containing protein [Burkholderiaceae bacterium]|nr:cyclic nucleotide-binding domain-containing protein [Burkholderiaceae bacterium]
MKTPIVISDMTAQDVEDLMAYAQVRSFPRHAIIINEGDDSDSVYFIISGLVKVFLADDDGNEVIMANLKAGEYFGEMALEAGFRSASVMAVESVSLAVVRMPEFRTFLRTHPDFVFSLLGKLIRRTRLVTRNLKGLALLDVYGRLTQMLNDLAENIGDKRLIVEPLTQQEMASRIGCSREMVSKILKDLSAGGYVEISRKSIEIKRPLPASW